MNIKQRLNEINFIAHVAAKTDVDRNEHTPMKRTNTKYTVWVGGSEINDDYGDHYTATMIAEQWIKQGYDDVKIERINQ